MDIKVCIDVVEKLFKSLLIGGDGEIRTHGPTCVSRQVSNLLP